MIFSLYDYWELIIINYINKERNMANYHNNLINIFSTEIIKFKNVFGKSNLLIQQYKLSIADHLLITNSLDFI